MLKDSIYENMINLMIGSVPSALIAIDKNDNVQYLNLEKYKDKHINKVLGKSFFHLIHLLLGEEKIQEIYDVYMQVKTKRETIELLNYKYSTLHNFNENYYNLKFMFDETDNFVICFIQNITEEVLLVEEFEKVVQEYEQTTAELKQSLSELDIQLMESEK